MNSFLKSGLLYGSIRLSWHSILFIFLVATITSRSTAQEAAWKCPDKTYGFTGLRTPTLCEQNPNFQCETQIGLGTPFPKASLLNSSVLSGNVCVVGNFEVDVPFTFQSAVVKINSGVTIAVNPSPNGYDSGSWLGIDNSKLFACNGLWNGITLGHLSAITTWNHSEIEDAEKAIFASSFCALSIQQTIFNRNRVGIELYTPFPNIWVPGPVMWVFQGNQFTCTAPLNGTTNALTEIGVNLRDADLFPFFANNNNTFRGIINGIVAKSSGSNAFAFCNVFANQYHFERILDKGINFEGRSLEVRGSHFTDFGNNGILFTNSSFLSLRGNEFSLAATEEASDQPRIMVEIFNAPAGNDMVITGNNFFTSGTMSGRPLVGVRASSDAYSALNTYIGHNTFDFQNTGTLGSLTDLQSDEIEVLGFLSSDSDIDIEVNTFHLFDGSVNKNRALYLETGTVNVVGNTFDGAGTHLFAFGGINPGFSILDNTLNPGDNFGTGMEFLDVPNSNICSNTNNGASNVGYLFMGQNLGTVFSGNQTYGCWQHTFWITGNQPVIGQQPHNGNEWGPAVVFNPNGPSGPGNYFERPLLQHNDQDPDIVDMSKFTIHTPQSVWDGNQYTFFSPFHPATDEVNPDFNDEFFFPDLEGTPSINCLTQLQAPDEVDLLIANGGFAGRIDNAGSVFDAKRYLYHKLLENPAYQGLSTSFGSFLTDEQSTSIGKFYLLEKALNDAQKLNISDKTVLETSKTQRDAVVEAMNQQGMSQSQLLAKISELAGLGEDVQEIVTQKETSGAVLFSNAMSIWQSIVPQNIFEQYRKDVMGIYLTAHIQQGGLLTEEQVKDLQNIARLCPEEGGAAVYLAQSLLPECYRAEIQTLIDECRKTPEADQREKTGARHILISEDAQAHISPNPARDWVNVVSVRQMAGRAEIFSLTGQLMGSQIISFGDNPFRVDLHSGVYVLKVTYENGDIASYKLLINR